MDGRQTKLSENSLQVLVRINVKEYLGNHSTSLWKHSPEIYSEPFSYGRYIALSKLYDGWLTIGRDSFDEKFAPKFGKVKG